MPSEGHLPSADDEAEQRRALTLLRSVFDHVLDGLAIIDARGIVHRFNPAAARMFGYAPDEVLGRNISMLMPEPDRSKHDQYIGAYLNSRKANIIGIGREAKGQRKDGTQFPLRLAVSEFVLDGEIMFIGSMTDLSESKRLEDQLRQAQKLEAFGQLAGGVAHDFNNLMTIVQGYGSMALSKLKPEDPLHARISAIVRAGSRATDLTRQLLAFSRKQTVTPVVLNINKAVEDATKMLKRIIGEDVELTLNLAPDLRHCCMDPIQIEQILMNLLVNARDAMPNGGKACISTDNETVDRSYLARHPQMRPGDYIRLVVSDTGHGMDEKTRVRIFEPFFTTKEIGKGTGLGLATVYGIVKQCNGFIWVYSEPGLGATFKVYLPSVDAPITPREAAEFDGKTVAGHETILLVEDDRDIRELARTTLAELGYRVLLAEHGSAALDILRAGQEKVHLVATDMVMPVMNGKDLIGHLRAEFPDLKILLISGFGVHPLMRTEMLPPGIPQLEKPFMPRRFAAKVREILGA
ncbi:MAG: PAS domain S-box protein [Planctomycetota bacterium]|nr:PAS domain S-box protein [Planctomycetota bacterium]